MTEQQLLIIYNSIKKLTFVREVGIVYGDSLKIIVKVGFWDWLYHKRLLKVLVIMEISLVSIAFIEGVDVKIVWR